MADIFGLTVLAALLLIWGLLSNMAAAQLGSLALGVVVSSLALLILGLMLYRARG